jgi:hypothetical protein
MMDGVLRPRTFVMPTFSITAPALALAGLLALLLIAVRLLRTRLRPSSRHGDGTPIDADDMASHLAPEPVIARSRPTGRVYGELQRRVARPLKVASAGDYAERRGLSPLRRAYITRRETSGGGEALS